MTFANLAYLIMVIAGFSGFAVVLFTVWVWTNWALWTGSAKTAQHGGPRAVSETVEHSRAA